MHITYRVRHCAKCYLSIISFTLVILGGTHPFTTEEMEVLRGEETCPTFHCKEISELELEPRSD